MQVSFVIPSFGIFAPLADSVSGRIHGLRADGNTCILHQMFPGNRSHSRKVRSMNHPFFSIIGSLIPVLAAGVFSGCGVRPVSAPPESVTVAPGSFHPLMLAAHGETKYRIVIADSASPATKYAAAELQRFLREISGAEFPIVSDRSRGRSREILLGEGARLRDVAPDIRLDSLGMEGYVIRTSGRRLIIAGGEPRGTLYGVYGFLGDHLGCRWFTPEASRIPRREYLEIPPLDEARVPRFEYRETYIREAADGDWAARNRLNRNGRDGGLGERHGGRIEFVPGYFAHTFDRLVPTEKYYADHPEYYSLVNGKRLGEQNQLCCTNEDVIRIATESVLRIFRENPGADVVSISQNDWYNACECPECSALAASEGTQMAPVLFLVNRVAGAVEREFPGKRVETLAYQWTRKPPAAMRPRPNVVIRLCDIECCFAHPLRTCDGPANAAFVRDLEGWGKISDHLWVWNYTTSFSHFFIPFPDLGSRADNVRLFAENHVTGVFQQDIYTTPRGEFSDLSAWLNATLLWNPAYDARTAVCEFLDGVYGRAAGPILAWLDLIHGAVERENIHMGVWQGPDAGYLTDEILARGDSLWDAAERLAAGDSVLLARVRTERLSLDYAVICRDRLRGGAFTVDQDSLRLLVNPAFAARLDRFCRVAAASGVVQLKEYTTTVNAFRKEVNAEVVSKPLPLVPAAAIGDTLPGLSYRYFRGSWRKLPDFGALAPDSTGTCGKFTLPFAGGGSTYGFTLAGYITVPRDGVYAFWTRSDGYSALTVAGNEIIRNGGSDPVRERIGHIALAAGAHPVTLTYFTREGCTRLDVFWSGPGFGREEIPAETFFRDAVPVTTGRADAGEVRGDAAAKGKGRENVPGGGR